MDRDLKIWKGSVPLKDPAKLAILLSDTPDWIAQKVATGELGTAATYFAPGFAAYHFPQGRGAYFVMSDGVLVTLFSVWYLSEKEARDIALEFDDSVSWTSQEFHDMVNRVLGTSVPRAQ